MAAWQPQDLARYIDHTLLRADATWADVERICGEAMDHGFAAACVNPVFVARVRRRLFRSAVKTCTVIGFPLGANASGVKRFEAVQARNEGAQEIDMVIGLGALKAGADAAVKDDITAVVEAVGTDVTVKAILETCFLTQDETRRACLLTLQAGAHFVKTSTGFGPAGATIEAVRLMADAVGGRMGIKASGGIADFATACAMIEAGATRLGTSASLKIIGAVPTKKR